MKTIEMPVTTETELLISFSQGDTTAFNRFYRKSSPRIFHYLLSILKNEAAAEDVLQSIYLEVHVNSSRLTGIKDLTVYLLRMGRNMAIDYLKSDPPEYLTDPTEFLLQVSHAGLPSK